MIAESKRIRRISILPCHDGRFVTVRVILSDLSKQDVVLRWDRATLYARELAKGAGIVLEKDGTRSPQKIRSLSGAIRHCTGDEELDLLFRGERGQSATSWSVILLEGLVVSKFACPDGEVSFAVAQERAARLARCLAEACDVRARGGIGDDLLGRSIETVQSLRWDNAPRSVVASFREKESRR